jgi:hypothetical protein
VTNCPKLQATENCSQTSGGSWLCVPKATTPAVERAAHTGNLYEIRQAQEERKNTAERINALGPGWREVPASEKCPPGFTGSTFINGQKFCHINPSGLENRALNSLAKVHNTQIPTR